ncbi:hypothetical protein PPYR_13574, partial [Photinus pyralis]
VKHAEGIVIEFCKRPEADVASERVQIWGDPNVVGRTNSVRDLANWFDNQKSPRAVDILHYHRGGNVKKNVDVPSTLPGVSEGLARTESNDSFEEKDEFGTSLTTKLLMCLVVVYSFILFKFLWEYTGTVPQA